MTDVTIAAPPFEAAHPLGQTRPTHIPLATAEAWESELAELSAHLEHATWRQLTLIRQLEPTMLWAVHGATSFPVWLSWRIGLAPHAAREKIRVARALAQLPRIDAAFSQGRLSFSKVRALTRVADASNEANLLEMALHAPAAELERICRGVRRVVRNEEGDIAAPEPVERWARQRVMDDGSVRIEAQLLPDEAARVWRAIDLARELGLGGPGADERLDAATALVRLADAFLARPVQDDAPMSSPRGEIAIVLERDRLQDDPSALTARLEDGAHVPAETLRRVACDCAVRAVIADPAGSPLDVGRRTRVIPERLRRALTLRDRHCRFPGCTHRTWLDAHHVQHWLHGGATDLANLVLLCPTHHRLVHEGGVTLELDGGETIARLPGGRALPRTFSDARAPRPILEVLRVTAVTALDDETLLPARVLARGGLGRERAERADGRGRSGRADGSSDRGGTGGRSISRRAWRRGCRGGLRRSRTEPGGVLARGGRAPQRALRSRREATGAGEPMDRRGWKLRSSAQKNSSEPRS